MFETFFHNKFNVDGFDIDFVKAGAGPGLLLLHGFPETKMAWHKIADKLAEKPGYF